MSLATAQISPTAAQMSVIVVLKRRLRISSKSTILVHIASESYMSACSRSEYRRLRDHTTMI